MPALIKPSRLAAAVRAEPVPQGGLLTVSAFLLFDFESPRNLLSEQALWPMVAEQMPAGAIFDKGNLKPRGEVIIVGSALAPSDVPVTGLQVVARVGPIEKTLNVFGDRFWRRTDRGVVLTQPIPFDSMPIDEAHAFGGTRFAENPRGKGHEARAFLESGYDAPLPNVENPQRLIRSPEDQVRPAHFGPLAPDAVSRMRYAGTYDQSWIKNRAPMKPDDFNPLFHCDAPEDQRLGTFFSGDERFSVSGMSRGQSVAGGLLPNMAVRGFVHRPDDDSLTEIRLVCDTVTLFPNITKAVMTFRGVARAQDQFCDDIGAVMLACEHKEDEPRPGSYYENIFRLRSDPEQAHKHVLSDFQLMPLRDEAAIGQRRAARIERAKQSHQTFVDNQNWLIRKTMADQGVSPLLAPEAKLGELADLPVVPIPTREEIEAGEIDLAELLDDVDALAKAVTAKSDFYTAKAELSRRIAVEAIPPSMRSRHMLQPLASEEELARYPDLTPFDGLSDDFAADVSKMRPGTPSDEDFAARTAGARERVEALLAEFDAEKKTNPAVLEEQYQKACARALKLPEGSMLHDVRLQVEGIDLQPFGLPSNVDPDESASAADARQRLAELYDRPVEELVTANPPKSAVSPMPDADGNAMDTPKEVVESLRAARKTIASLLPKVAAEAKSESLDDMLATLIAGLPASPSAASGQTLREAQSQAVADASQKLAEAETLVDEMMSDARRKSPAAIFPMEPLGPTVSERLGAFIVERLGQGHDFSGADLAGAELPGLDLRGLPFRSTFFERCNLHGTDFSGTDLNGAVFTEANLQGANFAGALIEGLNINKADLRGTCFDGCSLSKTTLIGTDLRGASFRKTTLTEVVFIDCQLDGADFSDALLADFHILRGQADGFIAAEAEIARGVFIDVSMQRCVFKGAGFERTTFANVNAQHADFTGAHLAGSSFIGTCDLSDGVFTQAVAVGSSWNGSILTRSCFLRATLNRSLFNRCEMAHSDLRLASFREGRLDRSILAGSDLFGANLYAASLAGCDLTRASLRGANLYFANLDGAKLGSCDLTGANLGKTLMETATDA